MPQKKTGKPGTTNAKPLAESHPAQNEISANTVKQLVVSIPFRALSSQNESFLAIATRRLREILTDAEKRRADGRVGVDITISGGQINGSLRFRPDWVEKLRP